MRLWILLLVFCTIVLVFAEAKSSKDSKSKGSGSKSSGKIGKIIKAKPKPIRHHSSESSESEESSEENRNKHKKKHSEKFKIEERFHPRKGNSTVNHKKVSKLNFTSILSGGFNNKTGKHSSSKKNATSHGSLDHSGNKTLIGWKILTKSNSTKSASVNETNNYTLNNFLNNEKNSMISNGSHSHSINNKWNNTMNSPGYGWNINKTAHHQGGSVKGTDLVQGRDIKGLPPFPGWNVNATGPSQGWKNVNGTTSFAGWNINVTAPSQGWKNINGTAPLQGGKNNSVSVQSWNTPPSAPDYRKVFSAPDYNKDQRYYFSSPGTFGYFQRNPNSITGTKQLPYPLKPDNKIISNVSPEYGWDIPQLPYNNNDQHNTDGNLLNNYYPIYENYGSSKKSSSKKIAKGVKKIFKSIGKGTGKVLSNDEVKDAMKKAASSYFANPPPAGLIYNPPLSNLRQVFYGSISNAGREPLTADDWRSIIFGNVPRKAVTRNLYSAAFPETYQNLDLKAFSERGHLPDFNQTRYISYFLRPHYQKLFAGLQNEDLNKSFRVKRELSEKGKVLVKKINEFFLHERDCNDTILDARRKRDVMVRPLAKKTTSDFKEGENRVTDFPFSDVAAVVQSDNGVSVYEDLTKEIQVDSEFTKKYPSNYEENTIFNNSTEKHHLTTESSYLTSHNRTKLFPVSETIQEFLNKRPTTHLRVVDESLDEWKSKTPSDPPVSRNTDVIDWNDQKANPSKRFTRSDDVKYTPNEKDFTTSHRWLPKFQDSENEVNKPFITRNYKESSESDLSTGEFLNGGDIINNTPEITQGNSDHIQTPQGLSTVSNSTENTQETSSKTPFDSPKKSGFYFFGVYITDYNGKKWENHASDKFPDESYHIEPATEEAEKTTPMPTVSTNDDDSQTASLMENSAIPELSDTNLEVSENIRSNTPTEPILDAHTERPLTDSYQTFKPESTVYIPFRIHTITFFSWDDYAQEKKGKLSTHIYEGDLEPITAKASIIQAPLFSNRCARNQRMVKGRCRTIW